jgi:hypothetical protein
MEQNATKSMLHYTYEASVSIEISPLSDFSNMIKAWPMGLTDDSCERRNNKIQRKPQEDQAVSYPCDQ